jgi:hypothetical protein
MECIVKIDSTLRIMLISSFLVSCGGGGGSNTNSIGGVQYVEPKNVQLLNEVAAVEIAEQIGTRNFNDLTSVTSDLLGVEVEQYRLGAMNGTLHPAKVVDFFLGNENITNRLSDVLPGVEISMQDSCEIGTVSLKGNQNDLDGDIFLNIKFDDCLITMDGLQMTLNGALDIETSFDENYYYDAPFIMELENMGINTYGNGISDDYVMDGNFRCDVSENLEDMDCFINAVYVVDNKRHRYVNFTQNISYDYYGYTSSSKGRYVSPDYGSIDISGFKLDGFYDEFMVIKLTDFSIESIDGSVTGDKTIDIYYSRNNDPDYCETWLDGDGDNQTDNARDGDGNGYPDPVKVRVNW